MSDKNNDKKKKRKKLLGHSMVSFTILKKGNVDEKFVISCEVIVGECAATVVLICIVFYENYLCLLITVNGVRERMETRNGDLVSFCLLGSEII